MKEINSNNPPSYGRQEKDLSSISGISDFLVNNNAEMNSVYGLSPEPLSEVPQQNSAPQPPARSGGFNTLLGLGSALVIIAGIVFTSVNWSSISSYGHAVILLCASLFFFGISRVSSKCFNLERSSSVLFVLSSIFLAITTFSLGFMRLLGDKLTPGGEMSSLFYALCLLTFCAAMTFGAFSYKKRLYVWLSLLSASAALIFICREIFSPDASFTALALSLFSLALTLLFINKPEKPSLYRSELPAFAIINAAIFVAYSLITITPTAIYSLAFVFFALTFFMRALRNDTKSAVACGVCMLLITVAILISLDHHNPLSLLYATSGLAAVSVILYELRVFHQSGVKVLLGFSYSYIIMQIITSALLLDSDESALIISGTLALCLIAAAFGAVRSCNRFCASCIAPLFTLMSAFLVKLLPISDDFVYTIIAASVLIFGSLLLLIPPFLNDKSSAEPNSQRLFIFLNRLHSTFGDYFIVATLLICSVAVIDSGLLLPINILLLMVFCTELCLRGAHTNFWKYAIYIIGVLIPISVGNALESMDICDAGEIPLMTYFVLLLLMSLFALIKKPPRNRIFHPELAMLLIALVVTLSMGVLDYPYMLLTAVYCFIRAHITYNESSRTAQHFLAGGYVSILITTILVSMDHSDPSKLGLERLAISMSWASIAAIIMLLLCFFAVCFNLKSALIKPSSVISTACVSVLAFFFVIFAPADNALTLAIKLSLIAATALGGVLLKHNYSMWLTLPLSSVMAISYRGSLGDDVYYVVLALIAVISASAELLRRTYGNKNGRTDLNCFAPAALLASLIFCASSYKEPLLNFLGFVLMSLSCLLYLHRSSKASVRVSFLFAVTVLCFGASLLSGSLPTTLKAELLLAPILVWGIVFRAIEFKQMPSFSYIVSLITSILPLAILTALACSSGALLDCVFVGIIALAMVIAAFPLCRKRWLLIGMVSLLSVVLSVSISKASDNGWWIFLLFAGLLLISVAGYFEFQRKNAAKTADNSGAALKKWQW